MANFNEHLKKGAIAGIACGAVNCIVSYLKEKKKNPGLKFNFSQLLSYVLLGGVTGAAAGILPDKLEPANNPNHRKFVHSLTFYVI